MELDPDSNGYWRSPDIVPSITYSDIPRAVDFFTRVFSFRERAEARLTWPGGGMTWIEVGARGLFNIKTPDPSQAAPPPPSPHAKLKVYIDNLDAHYAHVRAQGARIVSEPADGFWGGRIYRALDHEGHLWEFAQRNRDLSAPLWKLPPGFTLGI
jgi:uncharacterized glyoxalase superfamily protein PhnB